MNRAILYIFLIFISSKVLSQGNFKGDLLRGCSPLSVRYTDLTPKAASWSWDLGNGNTSSLANPSAIYTTNGNYTIILKVTDSTGSVYTITKKNYIKVLKSPTASFSVSSRKVCPNDSLAFSNTSIAGDTAIKSYVWDFGDGNTSKKYNPKHAWTAAGFKTVSLFAVDDNGCTNQISNSAYIRVITPPLADFIIDTAFTCSKTQKVTFTNASTPNNLNFLWNFGDGTATSNLADPNHKYGKYGRYTVTLKVQDKNTGCYHTKTAFEAIILDSLVIDFTVKNKIICDKNIAAEFINLVPNYSDYKATWTYDDGTQSNNWEGPHTYANNGIYSIILEIKGTKCYAKKTKINLVTIAQIPALKIRANDTGSCGSPFKMKLIATTTKTATVFWNFGDKTTGSGAVITHQYPTFDSFYVTAISRESNGCSDTQNTWIKPNEIIAYANGNLEGCIPFTAKLNVRFKENTAKTTKVEWYYKNKRIDTGDICTYKFIDTGNYKIRLKVMNSKGCVDTPDINIGAGVKIKPSYKITPSSACLHDSVTFLNMTPNKAPGAHKFLWNVGEGGIQTGNKIIYNYGVSQGKMKVVLISNHFGCKDTFSSSDSLLIKSPRVAFQMPSLGCTLPNPIKIANLTNDNTYFKWFTIPPEKSKTKDTIYLDINKSNKYELHMIAKNDTNGCADSAKFDFNFNNNAPKAIAKYRILEPCPPAKILLFDSGSIGLITYWKLPNGDTIKNKDSLVLNINNYGNYRIKRYAINKFTYQQCVDSVELKITIPKPDSRFSISQTKGCSPLASIFVDSAYSNGRKAKWTFGDTSLISASNKNNFTFTHPFDSLKTTVRFTAWDSLGRCSATSVSIVEISGPKATIKYNPFYTCKNTNLQLSFTPITSKIKSWKWFADDTFIGTTSNASFIVYTPRNVKIELQITDSSGCTTSIVKNVFVRMFKPDVIIASDSSGALCPPLVVHFNDKSTSFNNPIETWLWDFGDGSTSTLKNPSHTYSNTGDYAITLKVKSFVGCFATKVFPAYIRIKGPRGNIISTKDSGCMPLAVKFQTTATGLKNVRWDFGDGFEDTGIIKTHIYKTAGNYTPSAIMEDSAGCKLGIQAGFKIKTLQTPFAKIKQITFCDNAMISFQDASNYFGNASNNLWVKNTTKIKSNSFAFVGQKGNADSFLFIAMGQYGCNDTLNVKPRKSTINVQLKISKDIACEGDSIQFTDLSTTDTSISNRTWFWQNKTSNLLSFKTPTLIAGFSDVKLKLINTLGCSDSITKQNILFTGSNSNPINPDIHFVTVTGDYSQQIHSVPFISNDWSQYKLYNVKGSVYNFVQTKSKNTDSLWNILGNNALANPQCFVLSNTNICDKESDYPGSIIHCTIELKAIGDTNKINLLWTPYIGQKTLEYTIERADVNSNIFIPIDSVSGDSLHYIDTSVTCTNRYAYKIKAKLSDKINNSLSDSAMASPIYKAKFNKAHISLVTVENNKHIRIDFEHLKTQNPPTKQYILSRSNNSIVYTNLKIFSPSEASAFIDNTANSDSSIYLYKMETIDGCNQIGPASEISNNILLKATINNNGDANLTWNSYKYWPGAVNHYEIQQRITDNNYISIASVVDTNYSLNSPGNQCGALPFYRIMAVSNMNIPFTDPNPKTSYSNTIALADKPMVFIPNTFTPNHDQLNQTFKPSLYWVKDAELSIYNRWGELLIKKEGCDASWDGTYKENILPEGIYIYKLNVTGTNNKRYYFNGTLQLIR